MTITGDIYVVLMSWAAMLSGYQYPEVMPQIVYVDHTRVVEVMCGGVDTKRNPCIVRAYYKDKNDARIYLNTKYWEINGEWSPHQRSIILHEMVHYLQDLSGKYDGHTTWNYDKLCAARKERQMEAYQTQDKYLFEVYGHKRLMPRHYDNCGMY